MEYALVSELRTSLAAPFRSDAARVRMPDRAHPAGIYQPGDTVPDPSLFPRVRGVFPVASVERFSDVLCFTFTDDLYALLVRTALDTLPVPASDMGSHAVNRMLRLSRHASAFTPFCPAIPSVRNAVFLAFLAPNGRGALRNAELAAERMLLDLAPASRPRAAERSALAADAVSRLLAAEISRSLSV